MKSKIHWWSQCIYHIIHCPDHMDCLLNGDKVEREVKLKVNELDTYSDGGREKRKKNIFAATQRLEGQAKTCLLKWKNDFWDASTICVRVSGDYHHCVKGVNWQWSRSFSRKGDDGATGIVLYRCHRMLNRFWLDTQERSSLFRLRVSIQYWLMSSYCILMMSLVSSPAGVIGKLTEHYFLMWHQGKILFIILRFPGNVCPKTSSSVCDWIIFWGGGSAIGTPPEPIIQKGGDRLFRRIIVTFYIFIRYIHERKDSLFSRASFNAREIFHNIKILLIKVNITTFFFFLMDLEVIKLAHWDPLYLLDL